MKKIIVAMLIVLVTIFISGCWNYREIDNMSITAGLAVDYDKERDKILLTTEIVYPMVESGETKLKSELVKSEGKNLFEAIRNAIQITGKRLFWAHSKVMIIGQEVAKNEEVLISIIDFSERDAEYRDDMWLIVSKEKTGHEILETDAIVQEIVSFQLEDILKNESAVGKYHIVPLWEFVSKLATEGVCPTLPTVRVSDFQDKKSVEMYGTEVFKGAKAVGWLDEEETKSFLFVDDEIKGGVMIVKQKIGDQSVKIALEILKNETTVEPIYKDGEITMKINTKTDVNINELETQHDFINEKGRDQVQKEAEKLIENKIKTVVKKVQKEYQSDIFGFGNSFERKYPKIWAKVEGNWDEIFKNVKVEVTSEVDILGSALKSKPIKVGD